MADMFSYHTRVMFGLLQIKHALYVYCQPVMLALFKGVVNNYNRPGGLKYSVMVTIVIPL